MERRRVCPMRALNPGETATRNPNPEMKTRARNVLVRLVEMRNIIPIPRVVGGIFDFQLE